MTLAQEVKQIISEILNIKIEELTNQVSLKDDLGADSLDIVELVMALELKFQIVISDENAEKLVTIGDVIKAIEDRKKS